MMPIVDGLEEEYRQRMAFLRLDADNDGRDAFVAFSLRGHPSYVIIDTEGSVLWKSVGKLPLSELEGTIQRAIGAFPTRPPS
jgi:hypothetical protein